jgi:hypothetical protein
MKKKTPETTYFSNFSLLEFAREKCKKHILWPVPTAAARGQEVVTFPSSKVLSRRLQIMKKQNRWVT